MTVLVYYFNSACCLYFIINYSWLIMDFGVDCILLIASDGFSEEHTVKCTVRSNGGPLSRESRVQ
jgi:hypothetical protein